MEKRRFPRQTLEWGPVVHWRSQHDKYGIMKNEMRSLSEEVYNIARYGNDARNP
jgi:hypothetical protein